MVTWEDLCWNKIYAEHSLIVKRALEQDNICISYIKKEYNTDLIQRIEDCCVNGLTELLDSFRKKFSKTAQPKDCAWAHLILDSEKYISIQNKLRADKLLKKAMGKYIEHESYNIAMAVSAEYITYVNNINNETD